MHDVDAMLRLQNIELMYIHTCPSTMIYSYVFFTFLQLHDGSHCQWIYQTCKIQSVHTRNNYVAGTHVCVPYRIKYFRMFHQEHYSQALFADSLLCSLWNLRLCFMMSLWHFISSIVFSNSVTIANNSNVPNKF